MRVQLLVIFSVFLVGGLLLSRAHAVSNGTPRVPPFVVITQEVNQLHERMANLEKQLALSNHALPTRENLLAQEDRLRNRINDHVSWTMERIRKEISGEYVKQFQEFTAKEQEAVIIFSSGIAIYLVLILGVIMWATRYIKLKIRENLVDVINQHRDIILQLVDEGSKERTIKESRAIVILGSEPDALRLLQDDLHKVGFKKISTKTVTSYEEISADMIIFTHDMAAKAVEENRADKENVSLIDHFLNNSSDDAYFVCYTEEKFVPVSKRPKINFANSPATLYNNVMAALKYLEERRA